MKKVTFTQDYAGMLIGQTVAMESQLAHSLVKKGVANFAEVATETESEPVQVTDDQPTKKPTKKRKSQS